MKFFVFCIVLTALAASGQTLPDDFSIVVLPDTQNYSQYYPQEFDSQTNWVAANAAAQNIKVVLGVGDIVNIGTDQTQWGNANHSIGILDQASIPYAFAIGNHDYSSGQPPVSRNATDFNQWMGPSRYASASYYGTSTYPSGSNENFYELFTWGSKTYLILALEYVPRNGALAWAKSVLSANSSAEAIIITHSYLYSDGTTVDQCDTSDMTADNNGAMQWQNLVSQFPNVSVVLSGHITNKFAAHRSDVGVNGNFVHQVFANWQDWTNGGNGYLRIMQFSPANNSIQVQTYSPYTGLYLTDAANQFALKWHNDGTPGSGTAIVNGRVRTNGSGLSCQPIANATVNVGGVATTSDSNGYFSVSLPPGKVSSTAGAAGYQTSSSVATLNDFFPNQLDFFLNPTPPCLQSSMDPSVTICTPANGANVVSPVQVVAGSNSSAPLISMSVWIGSAKAYGVGGTTLNTSVPMSLGPHQITVQAISSAKVTNQIISVNVVSPSPCLAGTVDPSVTICSPGTNAGLYSPAQVVAASKDSLANVVNMFIWVDGVKKWISAAGANSVNIPLSLTTGSHRVTVQAKDAAGRYFQSSINVTAH